MCYKTQTKNNISILKVTWTNNRSMIHTEGKNTLPDLGILARAEKLQLLYHQSYPALFISTLNAVLLSAILWSVQDHKVLIGWFTVLFTTALSRFYIFTRYRQIKPVGEAVLAWEKPYFVTLFLSSLIWGIGAVLIMPVDSPVHQAVIFYFLIGMSGGAISVYSAHRSMTLVTVAAVLLPTTGWFLFQHDFVFVGMAIGAVIFFISAVRSANVLSSALQQNFLMTHELKKSKEDAEKLARFDELTGLYNRRAFYEHGNILANHSQRNNEELAIIVMDIDNFKNINDRFGHAAGDAALKQIGKIMLQRLRKSDVFARLGGEEFGMLLPATSPKKAVKLAEELRRVIADTPVLFAAGSFSVTASFGVTAGQSDIDELVRHADMAMYQSKESGRNTVMSTITDINGDDGNLEAVQEQSG
jgi:diguanylate cyclase (GGDEF)-like protein